MVHYQKGFARQREATAIVSAVISLPLLLIDIKRELHNDTRHRPSMEDPENGKS